MEAVRRVHWGKRLGLKASLLILLISTLLTSILFYPQVILPSKAKDNVIRPLLWGGTKDEEAHSLAADLTGTLYMTGSTQSFATDTACGSYTCASVFLMKTGSSTPWIRIWGGNYGEVGEDVAVDPSNNIYVTGTTGAYGNAPTSTDVFLLKFSPNGTLSWQKTWGGSLYDNGQGIAVDASSNIYVTGSTSSFGYSPGQPFLLKFKPNGALVWQETWNVSFMVSGGNGVAVDPSGNVYVVGATGTFIPTGTASGPFVLKYDSQGQLLWQRSITLNDDAHALGVATDQFGNVFVTGEMNGFDGPPGIFLTRFDSSGRTAWLDTWGNPGSVGRSVSVDAESNIYVFGTERLSSGTRYVSVSKLDPQGNLLWEGVWGGTNDDEGFSGVVSFTGDVYVTGFVSGAPPYDYRAADTSITTPTYTVTAPNAGTSPVNGNVTNPRGNITELQVGYGNVTYAGGKDVFLATQTAPLNEISYSFSVLATSLLVGGFAAATILVTYRIRRVVRD